MNLDFLFPASSVPKDANDRYDYSDEQAMDLFKQSTKSLFPKNEYYDCKSEQMFVLLSTLAVRAGEVGWMAEPEGIMWIPELVDNVPPAGVEADNFLDSYGLIEEERIVAWEEGLIGAADYKIQENYMLFKCLWNTLSLSAKSQVSQKKDTYIRDGVSHGLSLLKVILSESHLDSNATEAALRREITELPEYILSINCDIKEFNMHVNRIIMSLTARDAETTEMKTNLFKAYKACKDEVFVKYIERHQSEHEDDGKPMSVKKLMKLANNKYDALVLKKEWEAPSATDAKILALQTEIKQLKKRGDKKNPKGSYKKGNETKKGSPKKGKPAWLDEHKPPKQSELKKPRTWNNLEWHWCHKDTGGKCDGRWVRHNPVSECLGLVKKDKNKRDNKAEKKGGGKKMKLTKQLEAQIADVDPSSGSESE